ncbi:hypothetical protein RRG08_015710 [Elysia crispata]|uniref:Uncharacterized protein n=1 Tax=Elysia crispata TaxID=231223 RepID=A0AAE1EE28_9GAST|nr:hypothetical protein RRG08_015710 [Elysia crispata]
MDRLGEDCAFKSELLEKFRTQNQPKRDYRRKRLQQSCYYRPLQVVTIKGQLVDFIPPASWDSAVYILQSLHRKHQTLDA